MHSPACFGQRRIVFLESSSKTAIFGKQKPRWQSKAEASRNGSGSKSRTTENTAERPEGSGNPLLPDGGLGTLSDFAVESREESLKDSTVGAPVEEGLSPLKYVIWVAALLGAIGVFYGLVFAASGSLSNFLKDKATFTRKDFIPYSEKRRLQQEAAAKERERLGIAEDAGSDAPGVKASSSEKPGSMLDFKSILPGS